MRSITSAMLGEPGKEIIGQASAERARMHSTTSAMQLMSWSLPLVDRRACAQWLTRSKATHVLKPRSLSASLNTDITGANMHFVAYMTTNAAPNGSNVAYGMPCATPNGGDATPNGYNVASGMLSGTAGVRAATNAGHNVDSGYNTM